MKKNLLILSLFIVLLGCDQTKNNWIKAKQTNSVAEVKKFIVENPSSKFDKEARIFLDSLLLKVAIQSNSVDSIQLFIDSKPNSSFIEKAKAAIDTLKKPILIPFKFDYKYVFSMPASGLTSGVASGEWDPALLTFDPPIFATGSFKFIKYKDTQIELIDNNITNGRIKTKDFGDFIVLLHGYRIDDGRSVISFISTYENISKLKKILQIQ